MNQSTDPDLFRVPLAEQASRLIQTLRQAPGDARLRVHYAQLCMVMGEWERAVGQLQTAAQLTPEAIAMAQAYREAIRCERIRERVLQGELSPSTIGEPAAWLQTLSQSLTSRAQGDSAQAAALQAQAFEQAPETPFLIDDEPVQWLADADSRLGPVLEAFLNGHYYWIAFEDIRTLELDAPTDLRDLVWTPARLTLVNGDQHPVLIPSRYPLSHAQGNDALALSSLTEWQALEEDLWAGLGQRMLVSSAGEHPLLGVRRITTRASAA
ncbi:virulence protein SciE type [Ectopseudomonas khazarica]|uniref:type VI secretion system accessory protein TagJ n=1 Tax=Ectopseudomonas khazarica TaxID=2502979 RepID=UPI0006468660|nr:type VI secretion system accessory protein TagJ [Pseudomonas khazarica]QTS86162.1 virulence protein SciE type [Pseudomonas khazarica]